MCLNDEISTNRNALGHDQGLLADSNTTGEVSLGFSESVKNRERFKDVTGLG